MSSRKNKATHTARHNEPSTSPEEDVIAAATMSLENSSPRRNRRRRRGPQEELDAIPGDPDKTAPMGGRGKRRRKAEEHHVVDAVDIVPPHVQGNAARATSLELKSPPQRETERLMDAVIKVFCTHSEPNFSLPWQRKRQFSSSGSGFVISGRRILTNAHCVDHHSQVKVKRRGSDMKYLASVLALGAECDIALLTVDDDEFWRGIRPVTFGRLPHLQDSVTVAGFPIGGDTLSVTSGVISRIETLSYVHGSAELLGVQVDAAINSGNSGGPAFDHEGNVVGIAFQSMAGSGEAENVSYIIPTPVIHHFISDFEKNGRYTGFPSLGVEWQKMENASLRDALGLKANQRGILIRKVEPTSAAAALLCPGDVLLAFDDVTIGADGTVPFRTGERIAFSYLVSQKMTGETAKLRLLSEGKIKEVILEMKPVGRLIPVHIDQQPPSYYIVGGLVFTPVTIPLLRAEFGKDFDFEAPVKLLDKMMHGMAENETQQIVVLSQVLAADVNVGYEELSSTQVLEVNGEKINNLAQLVHIVEGSTERYLRLDLEYSQMVVLDLKAAKEATPEIMKVHCISRDRSADLMAAKGGSRTIPRRTLKGR